MMRAVMLSGQTDSMTAIEVEGDYYPADPGRGMCPDYGATFEIVRVSMVFDTDTIIVAPDDIPFSALDDEWLRELEREALATIAGDTPALVGIAMIRAGRRAQEARHARA